MKQETQGYICPHTKKQCDDECCVSAKDCHLEASMGVLSEPKQETLEKAAERYVDSFKYSISHPRRVAIKSFINGAKWQTERSYSEEEVKIMYRTLWVGNWIDFDTSYEMESNFEHDFNLWFEQFKNK